MTITTDLDAAIDMALDCDDREKMFDSLRLRMGPGARKALMASCNPTSGVCIVVNGEPVEYFAIPIEAVDGPLHRDDPPTANKFMGWELARAR